MSVSERDSGIMDRHIQALEQTALSENTFIFVRPTEYDTTILIRAGYATKSMDVHHKSSNWGPMAGFVPCDPAFSKKCEGKPNAHEHEHKHGDAHPVQLALKNTLVNESQKIQVVTDFVLTAAPSTGPKLDVPWIAKRSGAKTGVAAAKSRFEAFQAVGHLPNHKFCVPNPTELGNKSTAFCLIEKGGEWLVYWISWEGETGKLNPLRVFAYPQKGTLNPVTGDYDLWMVAPHFKHLDRHLVVRLETDSHGSSAASGYTMNLITTMNANCDRTDNPVFNHGAEAQNYDFTQALDANLAMFTSSGQSRMVRINEVPGILGDLHQAGYLVVWNKRYGESDPRFMGKADARGANIGDLRNELDRLYRELDEFRKNPNNATPQQVSTQFQSSVTRGTPMMPGTMKAELGLMAQRFQASRNLGQEQSRVYRFNRALLDFLNKQMETFRVLSKGDFHPSFKQYDDETRRLHADLQRAMVNATAGGGATNEQQMKDWLNNHRPAIETLKRYWA